MPVQQFGQGKVNRSSRYAKSKPDRDTTVNENTLSADATGLASRFDDAAMKDKLDGMMGFERYESGPKKIGWLINMHTVRIIGSWSLYGGNSVANV